MDIKNFDDNGRPAMEQTRQKELETGQPTISGSTLYGTIWPTRVDAPSKKQVRIQIGKITFIRIRILMHPDPQRGKF